MTKLYRAKVFRIGKWPWTFKGKEIHSIIIIISEHNARYHKKILNWDITCVYTSRNKKWDFHHSRWRPYLIWPLHDLWHYGGWAPGWFFISRDPLTQSSEKFSQNLIVKGLTGQVLDYDQDTWHLLPQLCWWYAAQCAKSPDGTRPIDSLF